MNYRIFPVVILIDFANRFGVVLGNVPNVGKTIIIPAPKVEYVKSQPSGSSALNTPEEIPRNRSNSKLLGNTKSVKLESTSNMANAISDDGRKSINELTPRSEGPVDGNWGNWGKFGPCSRTCNEGVRERRRSCNNPAPQNGGKPCPGHEIQKRLCEMGRCVLESFDTEFRNGGMGTWKNFKSTPVFQWKIQNTQTNSTVKGPRRDATGDGYYLYADYSSSLKAEDQAKIVSEIFHPSQQASTMCLKFRYHMSGASTGLLSVMIIRKNEDETQIFSILGDQGNKWRHGKVTMESSVPYQVVFDAITGSMGVANIALDNIYLDNGPCTCQDSFQNCGEWSANGDCTTNYLWMSRKCKKTCDTCGCNNRHSNYKECDYWALTGYCPIGSPWMSVYCRRSCRFCGCEDKHEFEKCQTLVKKGACDTQMQWMMANCKLSCGFCDCKDTAGHSYCKKWSSEDQCNTNPSYMSENCQLSCGFCSCRDKSLKCNEWASNGGCSKYAHWMSVNCTRSCGHCKCHDDELECQTWAKSGECIRNLAYMSIHCKKSCGKC